MQQYRLVQSVPPVCTDTGGSVHKDEEGDILLTGL